MYRNYLRLQVLFLQICTKVLRHALEYFANKESGGDLKEFNFAGFINTKLDILKDLQHQKDITNTQVKAFKRGQNQEWDISLLAVVLLNMVQLGAKERAAVESIRKERNSIQHLNNCEVNDDSYKTIRDTVSNQLRLLASVAGPDFKAEIEIDLKTAEQLDAPGEPWITVFKEQLNESKMNLEVLQRLDSIDMNLQSLKEQRIPESGSSVPNNQCNTRIENNSSIFIETLMESPTFKIRRPLLQQSETFLTNQKVVVLTGHKKELVMSVLKYIVIGYPKEMKNVALVNTTSDWSSVSPENTGLIILKNIAGPWEKKESTKRHMLDKWINMFDEIHARAKGTSMSVAIVLKKSHLNEIKSLCDHKLLQNVVEIGVRDAAPDQRLIQSRIPSAGTDPESIFKEKDQRKTKLKMDKDDINAPTNLCKLVTSNTTSHSYISFILVSTAQDYIIVLDVWNWSIKLFDTEEHKLHSEINCNSKNWKEPWAVAELPNAQQFAVTFPKDNTIRMFRLTKEYRFPVLRNIPSDTIQTAAADCRGICSLEGYLVVSFGTAGDCCEHGIIQILKLTGEVYQQIDHKDGEPLFNNPKYLEMSTGKNLIHVSDEGKNKIITIDFEGIVWSEIDIQRPGYVVADPTKDDLLICSKDSRNLFQASCETDQCFEFETQHMQEEPIALAFDRDNQCLFVAFRGSPDVLKYPINI
ncbi:uncharacterized protein LOC128220276 isoform X2 [Mya arenaria]|nr:uncharacterized protein LOC128220276 isoform X2 [Mya arenaria]XP_052784573.1 uncharacterized protein LOC128220276 isoform X2 [Mya arenaria]